MIAPPGSPLGRADAGPTPQPLMPSTTPLVWVVVTALFLASYVIAAVAVFVVVKSRRRQPGG